MSPFDEGRTELLPAGQAMHSAAPVWLLYLPAAHRTQVPPLGPDEPALHVQSSDASLPDGELAWAGQLEHAVADKRDAAYLPVPHVTQSASPSLAVCLPAHSGKSASRSERHGVHRKLHVGVVVRRVVS